MRLFIVLLAVFITVPSFAQIGETEVKDNCIIVGQLGNVPVLQYTVLNGERHYMLIYQNREYTITDIKSLSWYGDEADLEYIYNFFLEGIGNEEQRSLKVGDDTVRTITIGKKSIRVFIDHKNDTEGWFYLSKKTLDKLFGKIE